MDKFAKWLEVSEKTPPVGHLLRDRFSDNWFRIHSLPKAKRYPDSVIEEKELKHRHLGIAKRVLGEGKCTVFIGKYGETKETLASSNEILGGLNLGFAFSFNIAEEEDDDPYYLNVYTGNIDIADEAYSKIIMAVSSEELGPVVFFSSKKSNAIAPYDGGADIFIFGTDDISTLKFRFSSWISKREDGL